MIVLSAAASVDIHDSTTCSAGGCPGFHRVATWRMALQPPLVISPNDLVVSRKPRDDSGIQECDTNVVVTLWNKDPTLSLAAQTAPEAIQSRRPSSIGAGFHGVDRCSRPD